jgi:hypothetical protein
MQCVAAGGCRVFPTTQFLLCQIGLKSTNLTFFSVLAYEVGRNSSVGIADSLWAAGSGDRILVGGGQIFRARPDWPWGPPNLL